MHRLFVVVTCLIVIASALGCASRADGNADDKELVPQCRSYLDRLNRCQSGISPDVVKQRTAATRQAFLVAAKDQAARERLSAQCAAAEQQISRACR